MTLPSLLIANFPRLYLEEIAKQIIKDDIYRMLVIPTTEISGSKFLNQIGLGEFENEMLFSILDLKTTQKEIEKVYNSISDKFKTKGFLYTIPIYRLYNLNNVENKIYKELSNVKKAVFIIVDKGNANKVIEQTNMLGARGASIINARGSGIYAEKYFDLKIEPEKEIVLVICSSELEEKIINHLNDKFSLDMPNKGILFSIELNNVVGV